MKKHIWLEDMKDPEVNAWFKAQADLTPTPTKAGTTCIFASV